MLDNVLKQALAALDSSLPLLASRTGLALVSSDWMQHNLDGRLRSIVLVSFAPVIADGVCEDIAVAVECGGSDRTTDFWIALQPVLGILVPEMKCAIAACCAEGAVNRME